MALELLATNRSSGVPHGTSNYTTSSITGNGKQRTLFFAGSMAVHASRAGLAATDLTISDSLGMSWTSRRELTVGSGAAAIRVWSALHLPALADFTITLGSGGKDIQAYRLGLWAVYGAADSPIGGVGSNSNSGDGSLSVTLDQTPFNNSRALHWIVNALSAGSPIIVAGSDTALSATSVVADYMIHGFGDKTDNNHINGLFYSDVLSGTGTSLGCGAVGIEVRELMAGYAPVWLRQ